MHYKKIAFTLLTLSTFNFACHHADPKVVAQIDSVMLVLDSCSKIATTIDFKKEEENAKKVKEDLSFIQANFSDTLNRSMGEILSDYRSLVEEEEEEGRRSENFDIMLKKELDYSKSQLLNLKHDFTSGDMAPADFKKYFETESTAVHKLSVFVKGKQTEFSKKEEQFSNLQPKVQAFIESIKK